MQTPFSYDDNYLSSSRRDGRLVVCLGNRLLGESLATALARRGWTIEAVGTTCADAVSAVALHHPDICLLGASLTTSSADPVTQLARARTRTVIVGDPVDRQTMQLARAAGVAAVLSEDRPVDRLDEALCRISRGETVIDVATVVPLRPGQAAQDAHRHSALSTLTSREQEVLRRMADGESTPEMARAMDVSTATVRSHIQRILGKLGVHTRLMAIAVCVGVAEGVEEADGADGAARARSVLRAV